MKFFNTAVGMMFILSTQHTLNNLISTTHLISNLSTQLSHPKSSGYVSAQYNKQKIREPEQFFQTVPTPGNPLFSALFRYSISQPVTSARHTPHVILRLLANISIPLKFMILKAFTALLAYQLYFLIRLFYISLMIIPPNMMNLFKSFKFTCYINHLIDTTSISPSFLSLALHEGNAVKPGLEI